MLLLLIMHRAFFRANPEGSLDGNSNFISSFINLYCLHQPIMGYRLIYY